MKTKEKKALHEKTVAELKTLLSELRLEIANLTLGVTKSKNTRLIYQKKKDISHFLTILRERKLAEKGGNVRA